MGVLQVTSEEEFDAVLASVSKYTLVVVDFHATWCGPCHRIAPVVANLSREHAGRAEFLKVDVDRVPDLAQHSSVRAMPTFHFFLGADRVDEMQGANAELLASKVKQWVDRARFEQSRDEASATGALPGTDEPKPGRKRHAPVREPVLFTGGDVTKAVTRLREPPSGGAGEDGDGLGAPAPSAAELAAITHLAEQLQAPGPGPGVASPQAAEAIGVLCTFVAAHPPDVAFPAVDASVSSGRHWPEPLRTEAALRRWPHSSPWP